MSKNQSLLRVEKVTKVYGAFPALNDISMEFARGELTAVMGENGAGKSTLMQIISGIIAPTEGRVEIIDLNSDQEFATASQSALENFVAIVPQEIELADERTVAQNIMMGIEPGGKLFPSKRQIFQDATLVLKEIGAEFEANCRAGDLDAVSKQLVLIARALVRKAEVIVFDEPTANLSPLESERLFQVIRKLKSAGKALIYVSHRIPEVMELSERIEVLRDGVHVVGVDTANTTEQFVVNSMVGREIDLSQRLEPVDKTTQVRLQVQNLSSKSLGPFDLSVKAGEVLGIAGLPDSGRAEFLELIYGLEKSLSGSVEVDGSKLTSHGISDSLRTGIGYLPGERRFAGIFPDLSVRENISALIVEKYSKFGIRQSTKLRTAATEFAKKVNVKAANFDLPITSLSGGNQQKALIARILASEPRVLLLDEPTRGVDIGAKSEIYNIILELTKEGLPVILSSSDLPELLCQSNRIAVMHRGKIVSILNANETNEEEIMTFATLGKREEVAL